MQKVLADRAALVDSSGRAHLYSYTQRKLFFRGLITWTSWGTVTPLVYTFCLHFLKMLLHRALLLRNVTPVSLSSPGKLFFYFGMEVLRIFFKYLRSSSSTVIYFEVHYFCSIFPCTQRALSVCKFGFSFISRIFLDNSFKY